VRVFFVCFQAEFLEETDEKEGPEIDEARNTIAEVEKVFETTEA
jgi:tubulin-specific chaperone A